MEKLINYVRSQVPLIDILKEHSKLIEHQGYLVGNCPLCGGSSSLSVDEIKKVWLCHKCHSGGDAISFIAYKNKISLNEATDLLIEKYKLSGPELETALLDSKISKDRIDKLNAEPLKFMPIDQAQEVFTSIYNAISHDPQKYSLGHITLGDGKDTRQLFIFTAVDADEKLGEFILECLEAQARRLAKHKKDLENNV